MSQDTVTPVTIRERQADFSIDGALAEPVIDSSISEAEIRQWTTQEVVAWLCELNIDGMGPVIECFEMHDINGTVLLALDYEDLQHELGIPSFGKRVKLWDEIMALRGGQCPRSLQPTPFQDTSRPCTANTKRSPSRNRNACETPVDCDATPITPAGGKKRRGRKAPKHLDIVTPAESVSIVAIEQLLPKPHKCQRRERCAKWRREQRQIKQLEEENGIGRFPISPTKGGRIYVAGDPGNASTADNIVPGVHKQPGEELFRPGSETIPSMVASSDLLGPGQLPSFALHPDMLEQLDKRDPQDNVRQFLTFQHMQSPVEAPPSPPPELAEPGSIPRSESVPLFPAHHHQAYPSLQSPVRSRTPGARENHKALPRLEIPRSASAAPNLNTIAFPEAITSACRTASPFDVYRLGTPASEMDVPVTAVPIGPVASDTSQSVPPNMQFRQQQALSRSYTARHGAPDWRRPSMALPAVQESEVLSPLSDSQSKSSRPSLSSHNSSDSQSSLGRKQTIRDPAHHSPTTQTFGYGADCTQAGWMKKRRTKMLRHEWQDAHFRLKGTQLAMHESARLTSVAKDTINVDDYSVACSSVASTNKLSAAMKAFHIKNSNADASKKGKQGETDPAAFAFQLIPSKDGDRKVASNAKTHHFAVKNKDERIDWMRELMLAKALQQKGKGYDVEINGIQA